MVGVIGEKILVCQVYVVVNHQLDPEDDNQEKVRVSGWSLVLFAVNVLLYCGTPLRLKKIHFNCLCFEEISKSAHLYFKSLKTQISGKDLCPEILF
jgi:hypothetical protein